MGDGTLLRKGELRLFMAVRKCDLVAVKELIDEGVSVKAIDGSGETLLHVAARVNCVKALQYLLKEFQANPNILCERKRSPLMIAAEEGHTKIAEILINHDADVGLVNPIYGFTALMRAAIRGRVKIVKLLLDNGADYSQKDKMGRTAFDHARKWGKENVAQMLAKAGATASSKTMEFETPRADDQVDSTDITPQQPESPKEAEIASDKGTEPTDKKSKLLKQRLEGMLEILEGVDISLAAGGEISTTISGSVKETFIKELLSQVLPHPFRFGSGQAIDDKGNLSEQLDVVIEYPFLPSFPIVGFSHSRLYLAEGIAAVIEVKTNLPKQKDPLVKQAERLARLERSLPTQSITGEAPVDRIPFFAVGYEGWKGDDRLKQMIKSLLVDTQHISGALQISPPCFVSRPNFGDFSLEGPKAIWGFIVCIHQAISAFSSMSFDLNKYRQLID
jgi:hypothetical protein